MNHFGLFPADILLPKQNFSQFSVIACDQYTSEPEYWERVIKFADGYPSAYNMILPEIFLSDNPEKRIDDINSTMQKYIEDDVFECHKDSMIYLERTLHDGRVRKGIVGLIDLNDYDYSSHSRSLIRATEQTVLERIPPRVKIRRDAPLEMPHIMLLIDDPDMTVIEPLCSRKADFDKAYDFELMCDAGHLNGYFADKTAQQNISAALEKLVDNSEDKLLFAVGDGNHSLATAKECYKLNKTEKSRYALVEVVNIHDNSLEFEPIYRVIWGADYDDITTYLKANAPVESEKESQKFSVIHDGKTDELLLKNLSKLPVGTLQSLLDEYISKNPQIKIDYIHGIQSVKDICKQKGTVGFVFDGMKKDELFAAIKQDGSLPRKTFSMGHADDKRFYVESRLIK